MYPTLEGSRAAAASGVVARVRVEGDLDGRPSATDAAARSAIPAGPIARTIYQLLAGLNETRDDRAGAVNSNRDVERSRDR